MSEQPGRYQRSANGMVGSMIVLVLLVLAFVGFRALNRDDGPTPLPQADYAPSARAAARDGKLHLFAPPRLPGGWQATSVEYNPAPTPRWHLGVITSNAQYVGLEESTSPVGEMVASHVDEAAKAGGSTRLTGPGGDRTWQVWTDSGGDTAVSVRIDGTTVLVVGSASRDEIEAYASSLAPIT